MILDIDIGNSAIKWRISDQRNILLRGSVSHHQDDWSPLLDHALDLRRIRVSNVGGVALGENLSRWLEKQLDITAEFAQSQVRTAGLINGYSQPQTLGVDRWLAVVASWNIVQGPCLVVDAGSALTVDFVSSAGLHGGGYIVPGLYMMFESLYGGTADVRFERDRIYAQSPGTNTTEAVQNGCFAMSVALVEKSLGVLEENETEVTLVLTGGGAQSLSQCFQDKKLLHAPDLVLAGLDFALP